jgi:hypothetical protein
MNKKKNEINWLVRPRTIRWLVVAGSVILALTIAMQSVIKVKGHFGIDSLIGFGAVFGFLCCVAMVLVARLLGRFLKREEHFYDD